MCPDAGTLDPAAPPSAASPQSPLPSFRLGYYRSDGPAGSDQERRSFLTQLADANGIRFEEVPFRYREEALEAFRSGKLHYLYDPNWVAQNGGSRIVLTLAAVCSGVLGLFALGLVWVALTGGVRPQAEFTDRMLVLFFAGLLCIPIYFALQVCRSELRLIRGVVAEIQSHGAVLQRADRAPILNRARSATTAASSEPSQSAFE